MSLIVTGSIGIDSVESPMGQADDVLGGSCSHFAAAASFFVPVRLVGAVGEDFPNQFLDVFRHFDIDLAGLEKRTGRRIPILVRVPSGGFLFDLAMGMDTEAWIREGLIDELQLAPQENRCCGFGSHDVRPYLELCRKHGIPVFGGVNGITGTGPVSGLSAEKEASGPIYSPAVGIKRAIGLIRAGVDGVEVYESEQFAHMSHVRWLIPLWGNAELAEKVLNESNIEAVYPVTASNAACGHDNHWMPGHSVYGTDQFPRGAARLV